MKPSASADTERNGTRVRLLWKIFLAALAIRWTYSLVIFLSMGENGLNGQDSYAYLNQGMAFAAKITAGSVSGALWLGAEPVTMPLMTWLITANVLLFGSLAPLTYILMQGVFDAGTCLLVYAIASTIDRRIALPAAIAACINPTQIILAGFVYTDTPFTFFAALSLFAAARWLRAPSWRWAIWLGIGLGAAAMVRVLIAPWIPALALFLLASAALIHRFHMRQLAQIAVMIAIAGIGIVSLAVRNSTQYGHWALTPQTGFHLMGWVAPLVKEARDGTPWAQTYDLLHERKRTRYGTPSSNPFEESLRFQEIAREELKTLGTLAILKAWGLGAAINVASPAIILSPPVSNLPRTGFFGTAGSSFLEKIGNFLFRSDNILYAWILQLGILGVLFMRGIQFAGLIEILRDRRNLAIVLLFIGWIAFILLVNGPIASPKYRLPFEPVLAVFSGAGFYVLQRRWKRKAQRIDAPR